MLGCDCGSLFVCLWLLCVFMFVRMRFLLFLMMEEEAFMCLDAIACLFVRTRRLHIPGERLTD